MKPQALRRITGTAGVSALLVLAGCYGNTISVPEYDKAELQRQRQAVLAATDWKNMIDVTIEMRDYGYRPRELRLKSGQPYRLTLVNYGSVNHYFKAPEFLRASATRKAEVRHQAEFKAPVFTSFELYGRGGSLDLYIVPMVKGTYRAYCHMKDHLELGFEGFLIVE